MKILTLNPTSALLVLLCLPLLFVSCKNKTDDPKVEAPANLIYSPNSATFKRGVEVNSSAPTISGTTPITYTLTTIPDASGNITIDPESGIITASRATQEGTFKATVIAKNDATSTTFASAFTFIVTANPDLVLFDKDIKPIIIANCSPCHVAGGSQTQYENYANSRGSANTIISRTNLNQGSQGFMPKDGNKLSSAELALFNQWKTDGLLEK